MSSHAKKTLMQLVGSVATILNFIVAMIVAFETILRFFIFLREWKPVRKKRMGFHPRDTL